MPKHSRAFLIALYTNTVVGVADIGITIFLLWHDFFISNIGNFFGLESLAAILEKLFGTLSTHGYLLAVFYFASHGIIKIALSIVLMRGRLLLYPYAIIFFAGFTVYQLIQLPTHHQTLDIVLLCVNALVCTIVFREYHTLKRAVLY